MTIGTAADPTRGGDTSPSSPTLSGLHDQLGNAVVGLDRDPEHTDRPIRRGLRPLLKSRRALIERRVIANGEVRFASLATEFSVSEMTIRRDVDALVARGSVRRVAGGAIAIRSSKEGVLAHGANAVHHVLAECVMRQFTVGCSVHLTPGPISRCIAEIATKRHMTLTVVTTDVQVARTLAEADRCHVYMPGGQLLRDDRNVVVKGMTGAFSRLHCDLLVLNSVAVHHRLGISVSDPEVARNLGHAIAASQQSVVVADAETLDRAMFAHVCTLDEIDALVIAPTNEGSATIARARRSGVTVLTAPRFTAGVRQARP